MGPCFPKKSVKEFFGLRQLKKVTNCFPYPCPPKKGVQISKFHQFLLLGGYSLQILWPSIAEARVNLPNVLAKILWSFLSGAPQSETWLIYLAVNKQTLSTSTKSQYLRLYSKSSLTLNEWGVKSDIPLFKCQCCFWIAGGWLVT